MEEDRKRPFEGSAQQEEQTEISKRRTQKEWTPDVHRALVEAIFMIGMSHASPTAVAKSMSADPNVLTTERIKSHLQKFRKYKEKSRREFMSEYDTVVQDGLPRKRPTAFQEPSLSGNESPPSNRIPRDRRGGAAAAHLTLQIMLENHGVRTSSDLEGGAVNSDSALLASGVHDGFILRPDLSDREAESPVGRALLHAVRALQALTEQVHFDREARNCSLPTEEWSHRQINTPNASYDAVDDSTQTDKEINEQKAPPMGVVQGATETSVATAFCTGEPKEDLQAHSTNASSTNTE